MKKLIALVFALATAFGLAACSDDEGHSGHDSSSSSSGIAESEEFNRADVDFATDMIQHHGPGSLHG